jgi:hypothetical protein
LFGFFWGKIGDLGVKKSVFRGFWGSKMDLKAKEEREPFRERDDF